MAESVLDQEIIAELVELMGDDIQTLVDTFVNDSRQRIESLRELIQTKHSEDVRKAAHSFKGSCANLGASGLANHLKELEDAAIAEQWQVCADLMQNIESLYSVVESELQSL